MFVHYLAYILVIVTAQTAALNCYVSQDESDATVYTLITCPNGTLYCSVARTNGANNEIGRYCLPNLKFCPGNIGDRTYTCCTTDGCNNPPSASVKPPLQQPPYCGNAKSGEAAGVVRMWLQHTRVCLFAVPIH
jgi:hypothetical protein